MLEPTLALDLPPTVSIVTGLAVILAVVLLWKAMKFAIKVGMLVAGGVIIYMLARAGGFV